VAKDLGRWLIVAAGAVFLAPLWLLAWCERLLGHDHWFAGCSELLSLIPGKPGVFLRRSFYRMTLDDCAIDVHIGFGTTLAHWRVIIGRGVYVGNRCTLGMCVLADHVTIGSNVDVLSGRHQHFTIDPILPLQHQGGRFIPIQIGRNSWIGNSSVIMADIREAAVIGAGSVVVQPIPPSAIAAGNPAVVKRMRSAA
jgi:acetyltransferase-like isoleucine patch superfamily enzyme